MAIEVPETTNIALCQQPVPQLPKCFRRQASNCEGRYLQGLGLRDPNVSPCVRRPQSGVAQQIPSGQVTAPT